MSNAPAAAPAASGVPAAAAPAAAPAPAAPAAGAPGEGAPAGEQTADQIAAAAAEAANAGKTTEQIAADQAAAEAAALAAAGAPEAYADFTAPEGAALDAGVMTKFADAARALNLPQDKAQALVDQMAPIIASRQHEQIEQLKTDWLAATTTDAEIGGAKLDASKVFAARAMDKFATPELKEIFNATGFGNHPDVMRMMVKVGQAISEDKIVTGGVPASGTGIRSAAEVLYPSAKPK